MSQPTKEQIEAERKKLLEMMPTIRRYSAFGDDHHAAIKACLRILDGRDTSEDYDYAAENVRYEAYQAELWMKGEADEDYSPTDNWKVLQVEK